jgi:ABC-type transport system substrate-binding protein
VVSNGGKTLTIHIRPGIHYSPPLQNKTVTSSDIKYAMERCFLASVGNGYAEAYYNDIVGAPAAPVTKLPNITGLQTPNPTTLVIKTTVPVGVLTDANALGLPCTVPVPEYYAAKFDKGATSTYGMHEVFTGPYMIKGAGTGTVPTSGYQRPASCWCWFATRAGRPRRTRSVPPTSTRSSSRASTTPPSPAARHERLGMISGDFAAPPTSILQQG